MEPIYFIVQVFVLLLIVPFRYCDSSADTNDVWFRRLEAMEKNQRKSELHIQKLREQDQEKQKMIEIQAIKLECLEKEVSAQALKLHEQQHGCEDHMVKTVRIKDNGEGTGNTDRKPKESNTNTNPHIRDTSNAIKKRAGEGGIAFTAYLDHNVDLGAHQTLKLNQILLNDGNSYNNHTGVFTCPETGVYLFNFHIGERHEGSSPDVKGVGISLVVNSVAMVDAVVDAYQPSQDLQGGNTAILRIKAGDSVWLERDGGSHVASRSNYRITTFSAVYLYS